MTTLRDRAQRAARGFANGVLKRRPVELRQADLQQAVASRFPLRREGTVPLEFKDPTVRLDCGADRLGLELSISAQVLGTMTPSTRWLVVGKLHYARENGWFTLCQPDVKYLTAPADFDRQTGTRLVRKFLDTDMFGLLLADVPIYQLKATDTKQAMARKYLHSVTISEGKLAIWLRIE